jgi:hypothetical protein
LGDEALLRMVGFQAEQIEEARARGRLRVDPETLANHLGRISQTSVDRSWWAHVKLLKSKRWYRGGVYAVDGTMITIPYGQAENYEGAGKMGDACGYRLVVVLNIDEGHERVVGWALGPLARSEKALLGEMRFSDQAEGNLGASRGPSRTKPRGISEQGEGYLGPSRGVSLRPEDLTG